MVSASPLNSQATSYMPIRQVSKLMSFRFTALERTAPARSGRDIIPLDGSELSVIIPLGIREEYARLFHPSLWLHRTRA